MTYFHTQMLLRLITRRSLGCARFPVESAACDPSLLMVEENEANVQVSLIHSLSVVQGESPRKQQMTLWAFCR